MFAKVYRLWEEGRQLPRSQIRRLESKSAIGDMRIEADNDDLLCRTLRRARLFDYSKGFNHAVEALPPLFDVAVLCIKGRTMTMTGFERDPLFEKVYVQTWLVEILDGAPPTGQNSQNGKPDATELCEA